MLSEVPQLGGPGTRHLFFEERQWEKRCAKGRFACDALGRVLLAICEDVFVLMIQIGGFLEVALLFF